MPRINELASATAGDLSPSDFLVVYNTDSTGVKTQKLAVSEFQQASLTNGYWYQNSDFYIDGNHDSHADTILDVSESVETPIAVTSSIPTESGNELPEGIVDPWQPGSGTFVLTGMKSSDMLQFRFAVDIECFSDESSATLVLECVSPQGFTFTIEEQLVSMTEGAKVYEGLATVPVFVGDSLADNGTAAIITPKIRLNNTEGNILPRSFVLYMWR